MSKGEIPGKYISDPYRNSITTPEEWRKFKAARQAALLELQQPQTVNGETIAPVIDNTFAQMILKEDREYAITMGFSTVKKRNSQEVTPVKRRLPELKSLTTPTTPVLLIPGAPLTLLAPAQAYKIFTSSSVDEALAYASAFVVTAAGGMFFNSLAYLPYRRIEKMNSSPRKKIHA